MTCWTSRELRPVKMALRPEPATIQSVISAAVETVLPAIRAARHEFELLLPDEPLWLNVDADRIAQVIGNLLTNAAKYTPRGGKITLAPGDRRTE
jgi:signal transduction histidine kinase